jgi:hypothetical protein
MTTLSNAGYSGGSVIEEARPSFDGSRLRLDKYLEETTQELNTLTGLVSQGETIDHGSHDWMLAQVDFIVDTIGNESLELDNKMRSDLLQLLLAIANLNEQIRRQS